jgi:hypothetical protein
MRKGSHLYFIEVAPATIFAAWAYRRPHKYGGSDIIHRMNHAPYLCPEEDIPMKSLPNGAKPFIIETNECCGYRFIDATGYALNRWMIAKDLFTATTDAYTCARELDDFDSKKQGLFLEAIISRRVITRTKQHGQDNISYSEDVVDAGLRP